MNLQINVLHYSYIKGIIKSSRTLNFISTTLDLKKITLQTELCQFLFLSYLYANFCMKNQEQQFPRCSYVILHTKTKQM